METPAPRPPRTMWAAFADSFRGIGFLVASEHHARVHIAAAVVVVAAGVLCRLSLAEWSAVSLSIGLVWFAEAVNTAIEFVCDALHPEHHPIIGQAKDVASGAVLLAALAAACVGAATFGPRLVEALTG